jgi:hypothetical protein
MNASINIHRLILLFLGFLLLSLIPSFFGWFLAFTLVSVIAFVVICIIDYFRKTNIRKNFGLVLSTMIIALIISVIVLNVKFSGSV